MIRARIASNQTDRTFYRACDAFTPILDSGSKYGPDVGSQVGDQRETDPCGGRRGPQIALGQTTLGRCGFALSRARSSVFVLPEDVLDATNPGVSSQFCHGGLDPPTQGRLPDNKTLRQRSGDAEAL